MKLKLIMGSALLMLAATLTAQAQRTPVINQRQHNQVNRINQGVRSGELTHSEASHLRSREQNIRTDKRMARADGDMNRGERANLRHRENRLNRSIYNKKHNGRRY